MARRRGHAALILTTLVALTLTPGAGATLLSSRPAGAAAAAAPREVTITGDGVQTYPAYSPGIDRYGIRTGSGTAGRVLVTAGSPDAAATITVDGRPVGNGAATPVTGLEPGDEVSVTIADSVGTTHQSWIYLPAGFPAISTTQQTGRPVVKHVALTLSSTSGSQETVVDAEGVPVHVDTDDYSHNLMAQPNGHYTVARGDSVDLFASFGIVELDAAFRPVRELRMKSVDTTDFHDAVLLPGGGRILMAYVRNPATGVLESHLEEVDADGQVVLTWNSADHIDAAVDPVTRPLGDNAHLNSIEVMADGNLLLSFRHLSQVMKISRTDGHVIWRLGGVRSDFTFPDDPYGGPCAQHTARELPTGEIQIFDNGSRLNASTLDPICPDPEDPDGARVERPFSRVTTYRLDETTGEAQLVDAHPVGGFSQFAGSAQRLGAGTPSDHVLIGLSNGVTDGGGSMPDALELDPDGDVVWSLSAEDSGTYRALDVPALDVQAPIVTLEGIAEGASYAAESPPRAEYSCTDRGGSNLVSCSAGVPSGALTSTTPGPHTLTVTARDGAGSTTTRTVAWTVLAPTTQSTAQPTSPTPVPDAVRPDVMARRPGGEWRGEGAFGRRQRITLATATPRRLVAHVRVRNAGQAPGRVLLDATAAPR